MNRIKFKLATILFFLLVGGSICFLPSASSAEYSPFDVPSTVRSGWNKTPGGKHYKENTGRMLIYDVYYNKYISGGQRIVNKNFNGTGTQPYLEFRGWSVIFGHKRHLSSNNETYIAAQKVAGSGAGTIKVFRAQTRGLNATEDLEYNNQGSGIYNECSASTTNTPNYDCNMRYESVGFDAYLPLNELFPDDSKDSVWSLYLIKKVDSHIVYTPLIVPFDFSNRDFKYGSISLSSGQNTNKLTMNTDEVLRRSKPREAAAVVRDELGSDRYFTNNTTYTRVDSEESQTAVWYGVKSPKDSNKTKWAATSYWRFSGDQARISYITENDPPEHIAHSITNHRYRDGSNHWVQPNDTVTVMLRQYDKESGNKNQFLRMLGSGVEVRARHDYFDATTHNYHWVKSNHLLIEAAKRTENTNYGKVEWSVTPKTHGHTYDVQYHYTDNVGNAVGYDTGSGNTGLKLSVDGVAPTNITNSLLGARYINGNDYWVRENDKVTITLRQRDPHSGNKNQFLRLLGSGVEVRSRHDFSGAADHNNHWIQSNHLVIDAASRTENTDYGTVNWSVTPKTHGHNYDIQYHYFDNVSNNRGYDTGEGDTGMNLRVDSVSPSHISHSLTGAKYVNNNVYWVNSDDKVTVQLRQHDGDSGNKRQYLRLAGNNIDVRSSHYFSETTNHQDPFFKSTHAVIEDASRQEQTAYGKVNWTVVPKTHGHLYDIQYYYQDNVDNISNVVIDEAAKGYQTTNMKLGVDDVGPVIQFRNFEDTADFASRKWSNEAIKIRLKFGDNHSGYKRSRYVWTQASTKPSESQWSSWSTSSNYVVTKAESGQWYLHVEAEDNVGNKGYMYKGQYQFNQPPIADFSYSPTTIYNDTNVKFTDASRDPDGDQLSYQWAYQQPGSSTWTNLSTAQHPSKVLNKKGSWNIRLTVTDSKGASDSVTKSPTVSNRAPVANFSFSPTTIYNDTTVTFKNSSTDADGDVLTYQWAYQQPDSSTWTNFSTAKDPTRVLNVKGNWNIRLTVTDSSGASHSVTKSPTVSNRAPVANFSFSPTTIYNDTTVTFKNSSTDADGDVLTYQWAYQQPDSSTWTNFSTAKDPTRVLNAKGNWNIRLTVTDSSGARHSVIKSPLVSNRAPKAGFLTDKTTYYRDGTIKVTSTATDPDGDSLTYLYELVKPDGTKVTSTASNPSFSGLDKPGAYAITQTVKDPDNATDSITKTVEVVNRPPTAGFNTDKSKYFNNESIKITSTASDIDGDKLTYVYELTKPDGSKVTSTAVNPTFNGLQQIGAYTIKQTVKDTYNATDTTSKTIEVVNRPSTITLTYDPTDPYEGDTINVCMRVHDADGHKMNVKIFVTEEGTAEKTVLTKTKVVSDTEHCYSFVSKHKKYTFRATSDDGYDETEVTTWVNVKPLILKGYVKHTPDWQNKHQSLGHKDNQFYSGEKFLLEADVSPYPIEYVKSTLKATQANSVSINRTVSLAKTTSILYKGELYDPAYIEYPTNIRPGPAIFEFEVKYTNGVIKRDSVPIEIIADSYKVFKLHRKY
ncbi:PKD domain-containing protein [Cytobacillus firmus]|uniref:PKD domain-containing protein n=1 Tax=Cytobacillus firmus TaxID=1399 RepID=UPI003002C523